MGEWVSLILSTVGFIYCTLRGAKHKRWAEGMLVGSVFGIYGVLIAYFFWEPSRDKSRVRTSPRNWSSWSGPEISTGCAFIGVSWLLARIYPFTPYRPLRPEQILGILFVIAFIGGSCILVGIWKADGKRMPTSAPRCAQCDYNLTGNISGVCPECGSNLDGESTTDATTQNPQRTSAD